MSGWLPDPQDSPEFWCGFIRSFKFSWNSSSILWFITPFRIITGFVYYDTGGDNPDFHRRLARYSEFCQPLDHATFNIGSASQLLAVVNHDNSASVLKALRSKLTGYSVIRSTSPLDGKSTWIEVFASGVSKSQCAAWLADRLNIDKELILAVGNDYNDLDLLEWAKTAFLVDNAPDMLKNRFVTVASHDHGGVSEAIHLWLADVTRHRNKR